MRGKFRSNQHGQQDVPTNKRQQGDINTNHSPPSAIASPSWCVQRPPKAPLTLHTSQSKRRERGSCISPPTTASKYTLFEGVSPPGSPESERKSNVPPRQPLPLPLSRTPTPAWGLLNFTGAFPPHPHPIAPGSRLPQAGYPGRLLTGGQPGKAESGAGAVRLHGGAGRPEPSSRGSEESA